MMKTIAEKIRLLRLEKGFSQENVADMLGISTTAYGDIERGKTDLTLSRLQSIAHVFSTSLRHLMGEEDVITSQIQQLELEKLKMENEKLRLENQLLKEKLAGRIIVDLLRERTQVPAERQRIGF
ncbi:transcriptional regulator with XRE-family HTH domain [Runella defluvii]|uniref:Transcriptional regulator with XRE-family HTH domain n=1 Tax=Runella defluvii TaxID=370973 RepID=A0A7W6ER50_9BACT|nr:helix-turn-helix transcriptional regulator [Runella defluvii]MBB3839147.1 transcriptional regulator with XRE-family HTH domain [Runella defluvii]